MHGGQGQQSVHFIGFDNLEQFIFGKRAHQFTNINDVLKLVKINELKQVILGQKISENFHWKIILEVFD